MMKKLISILIFQTVAILAASQIDSLIIQALNECSNGQTKYFVSNSTIYSNSSVKLNLNGVDIIVSGFRENIILKKRTKLKSRQAIQTRICEVLDSMLASLDLVKVSSNLSKTNIIFQNHEYFVDIFMDPNSSKRIDLNIIYNNRTQTSNNFLSNTSFETKTIGQSTNKNKTIMLAWNDCGIYLQSKESPFDIHPKSTGAWANNQFSPSDGESYIGLVARENGTRESISQPLLKKLDIDKTYSFNIDITSLDKNFANHRSQNPEFLFDQNLEIQIWLSTDPCKQDQLIYSKKIDYRNEWKTHHVSFKPNKTHTHLMITCNPIGHFEKVLGNIMIDNIHDFQEIHKKQ